MTDKTDKQTTPREPATKAESAKPAGRMLVLQLILGMNTVLIGLVVASVLGVIPKPNLPADSQAEDAQIAALTDPAPATPTDTKPPSAEELLGGQAVTESKSAGGQLSWRAAEQAFAREEYDVARSAFAKLVLNTKQIPAEELVADYFSLRVAQCLVGTGRVMEARRLLETLEGSKSPMIQAMAHMHQAKLDLQEGLFLQARTRAYQSQAAMGALERPTSLEGDSAYAVGLALTEKVHTFANTQQYLHWSPVFSQDPFAGLDREELRMLLGEGKGMIPSATLGPELKITGIPETPGRWTVTAGAVTIEEVLNQFGRQAGLDVRWENVEGMIRRRPISFHFRNVSTQQLAETAAGAAGLIARFTLEEILIYDPSVMASSVAQRDLLTKEAVSMWRQYFLRYPSDARVPEGHFALAAISEWEGETVTAANEYQLLANRFERSRVAPLALLRGAAIKMEMRDYKGARQSLLDLLDLYPNEPGADRVYLMLARVNEKAGHYRDAAGIYENLFQRNLSAMSRRDACLGAGRCHYELLEYDKASRWLARYVAMIEEPNPHGYAKAYFLLAKSEAKQNNLSVAAAAYRRGLLGNPPAEERITALLDLANVYAGQEDFVSALGILERLDKETLSLEQSARRSVQFAEVLLEMGLVDRARSMLRVELTKSKNRDFRAVIGIELARCHVRAEEYQAARSLLAELLPDLPEGKSMWAGTVLLAEVCLHLGENDQAISVAKPILATQCPVETRHAAQRILGKAYLAKKDYNRAAAYFSGLPDASVLLGQAEVTP